MPHPLAGLPGTETSREAALNLSPLDPIRALYWSAVVNGVLAAPLMAWITSQSAAHLKR